MTTGEKILLLRKKHAISQEMLAEKLNVSRQSISRWESDIAYPETKSILELAKYFNVSCDYLLSSNTLDTQKSSKKYALNFKSSNSILCASFLFITIISFILFQTNNYYLKITSYILYACGNFTIFLLHILFKNKYLNSITYTKDEISVIFKCTSLFYLFFLISIFIYINTLVSLLWVKIDILTELYVLVFSYKEFGEGLIYSIVPILSTFYFVFSIHKAYVYKTKIELPFYFKLFTLFLILTFSISHLCLREYFSLSYLFIICLVAFTFISFAIFLHVLYNNKKIWNHLLLIFYIFVTIAIMLTFITDEAIYVVYSSLFIIIIIYRVLRSYKKYNYLLILPFMLIANSACYYLYIIAESYIKFDESEGLVRDPLRSFICYYSSIIVFSIIFLIINKMLFSNKYIKNEN